MKLALSILVVLGSLAAFAEEVKCVKREVLLANKTNRSVIYEEKDEGKITGKVTVLECIKVQDQVKPKPAPKPAPKVGAVVIQPPRACQDCIKK